MRLQPSSYRLASCSHQNSKVLFTTSINPWAPTEKYATGWGIDQKIMFQKVEVRRIEYGFMTVNASSPEEAISKANQILQNNPEARIEESAVSVQQAIGILED